MRALNPTSSKLLDRLDIGRCRSQRLQSTVKLSLFRLQPLAKNLLHLLAQCEQVIDRHGFPVCLPITVHDAPPLMTPDSRSYRKTRRQLSLCRDEIRQIERAMSAATCKLREVASHPAIPARQRR